MSYRVRFTTQTGETGYWQGTFATRTGATMSAEARADMTGYTYHIEELPDDTDSLHGPPPTIGGGGGVTQGPTEAIGGAGGSAHAGPQHQAGAGSGVATRLFVGLDAMPPRVRQERRIRALAEAIVRRMGHGGACASILDLAHIHDWAAEVVQICWEMNGGGAPPYNSCTTRTTPQEVEHRRTIPAPSEQSLHHRNNSAGSEASPDNPDTIPTTERLVDLLRSRHAQGLAKYGVTVDRDDLTTEEWAQHAIEEMLDGAAYLMRFKATMPEAIRRLEADNRDLRGRLAVALRQRDEALAKVPSVPEPGSTAAHHVEILRGRVKELEAELAEAKTSLAKAPSVPASASEAPGEGGDSDRRRLEALERYLEGDTFREVWKTSMGPFAAGTKIEGQHFDAPTLAALADKLARKEGRP